MKNRCVSRRFLGIFCLALVALLSCARAWGYTLMGNDRILLMNDDTKFGAAVSSQGYYATNMTAKTYWVHDNTAPGLSPNLLRGANHTMFQQDGTRLWDLVNCRAGSGTVVGNTARNYIPWSSTAKSITDGTTKIPENNASAKAVGSVVFRNVQDACLYSPYYAEGIGTLYFDAVNSFVNAPDCEIALEIATNMTESAMSEGIEFASITNNYEDLDWVPCPVSIFTVSSESGPTNVTIQSDCETNVVVLGSTLGGSKLFYRMRVQLNWRAPIRFRIRRLNATGGHIDQAGLILLDNIVASYPPMGAVLGRYGTDYDSSLTGADVLGGCGDVNVPFLSMGLTNVVPFMSFSFLTNSSATTAAKIVNPAFCYRWRYLNQQLSEWKTIPFNHTTITSTSYTSTNLVGTSGIDLSMGTGDLEYFFEARIDAPYYAYRDYAYSSALPTIGYGGNWSEQITAITNRATYTVLDGLPSGGTDWFTRIREGESDYASISLVGEVTTNGEWGVDMHTVANNERTKMELVDDHTWRYHYYIPTNNIGERIRFHFEGVKYATNDVPFRFNISTNVWYANSTNVPYLPYTMAASGSAADANNAVVQLDGSATHLQIDFNDEVGTFALSRGTYQNFNMWTDANDGYRGHTSETTGVSDVKQRWDADIAEWVPTQYDNSLWRELFEVSDERIGPGKDYEYYKLGAWKTENGWSSENSMYVPRYRIAPYGLALQLSGEGKGALMLNAKDPAPNGIGTVDFAARVAQIPTFGGFCYDYYSAAMKNYAVSAKVTMSRLYESQYNPSDISPATPSVSLVGYYRGERSGCYEFRVTRSGNRQLTAALYRWENKKARLLVENVINVTSSGTSLAPSTQQKAWGVGGGLNSAPDSTSGATISNFNNLLVPMSSDNARLNEWTCMCLSLYSDDTSGAVYLDGYLSPNRNTSALSADSAVKRVVAFRDTSSDLTRGGAPGVGSVGCQAGFGAVYTHDFLDAANYSRGIDTATDHHPSVYSEWQYPPENWRRLNPGEFSYGAGFTALIPTNQTIKLFYSKLGKEEGNWIDSGWETNITAFATNTFTFAPCVAPDYLVRLQTGEGEAEIVIDSVEVNSWRAEDSPRISDKNDEWVYTMASIETSAEIKGAYDVEPAGTNGYVFIFNQAGYVTFTPQIDMVIDRVLLVGGGGSGGSTMGGGGGGGGVVEENWENNPVTVPAGTTIRITVGAGGAAPIPKYSSNSANSTSQPAGNSGGLSRVTGIPGKNLADAVGGGGGSGWSADPKTGGSGGGGANNRAGAGTTGQSKGNRGGQAVSVSSTHGLGGGGGGAGEAGQNGQDTEFVGGKGGDGWPSDITGEVCYYGGGGGGGVGWKNTAVGGAGGKCGPNGGSTSAGHGASYRAESTTLAAGLDGYGGGGGGGTYYDNNSDANVKKGAGAAGGCGCVILHVRTASKLCVLQPTRSYPIDGPNGQNADHPMGLRSKYLRNGLSLFSFSYLNADSNAVLRLQISTNIVSVGEVDDFTLESADGTDWTTLTNWSFKGLSPNELKEGTRTYFLSLRAPQTGLMRLVMDPAVVSNALVQAEDRATRDLDYGKIMITRAFCYDEPELDARSWWGWNLHTEGWGGGSKPGRWAYLTDSPDGLSCSLNFSALKDDNSPSKPETYGIGLGEPDKATEYAENNPFVQCPEMTNGIASVSFRARTFETNATSPSVVILYGAKDIGAYQPNDDEFGQVWKRLAEFVISNNTYQTYNWSTNNEGVAKNVRAVRLEVGGARHGRETDKATQDQVWEKPSYTPYRPIQRVFLDEVTVSEPVGPRLKFFDVRPFRSQLTDTSPKAIININDRDEQPLLGESWGIQARIEPQQMANELDLDSIRVKMAAYVGKSPWGYKNWKDIPVGNNKRYEAELTCVDTTNLIFRSTYDNPASVIAPVTAQDVGAPYAVVQYHVWAEFRRKDAPASETTPHDLDATEWVKPEWYWPQDFNAQYGFGLDDNFSAFTILDSISPGRAWFNEVNYNSASRSMDNFQFIELMVPEGVDLTGWRVKVFNRQGTNNFIATFGETPKAKDITIKFGSQPGVDSTNQFTVVSLATPAAEGSDLFAEGEVDGYWEKVPGFLANGVLTYSEPYGLELVRPSGVVEHQVVAQGTNTLAFIGGSYADQRSGSHLAETLNKADGSGTWFFAGENLAADDQTLGVWRGHGEKLWDGGPTWTNDLTATPGALNLRNGQRQFLDDWMLPPNGTNVWIYATVLGDHTWQYVDGNPANTNKNTLLVVSSGTTTNIRYVVDSWYELANCKVNEDDVTPTSVPGLARTFEIALVNVTNNKTTVTASDRGDSRLFGTNYAWQVAENDPYKPAILDWLLRKWPDKGPEDIVPVEHWNLSQTERVGYLDLREMYWLDIPPADGHIEDGKLVSDWRFLFGYTKPFTPFTTVEGGVTYAYNQIGAVKLLMTNKVDGTFHRPYTIQGLQPGSSSATDYATASENWTSATFKVTCALNYEDQGNIYKPVKWFVFDENSFDADGVAYIEVPDQSKSSTPGFNYGWSYYLGRTGFNFDAKLDESPSGLYSTEILRAIHTNSYNSIVSP